MTIVKGKGHIWPEYWIDCSQCDHHQPLSTTKEPSKAAREQRWRRIATGSWVCPSCVEHILEIQQINATSQRS